jgi:glycosyltransferase involved in cell wall biosynthesis
MGGSAVRILHVGAGNLGAGGVATYVRTVLSGQRDRGHDVLLADIRPDRVIDPGVEEVLPGLEDLPGLSARWSADVVHLHSTLPRYGGIPAASVITAHEHSSHCPSGGRFLQARGRECHRKFGTANCLWGRYVDRCGSRSPGAVARQFGVTAATPSFPGIWIAPSRFSRDRLLERGLDSRKVSLLPNPNPAIPQIPVDRRDNDPVVLFIGRLVAEKGCDVLLRAMVDLPRAQLRILGDGPDREHLEILCRRLGVDGRTSFLGWQPPGEVNRHLSEARVLALPARWPEPFGLVVLEAYSVGCPVVASAIGGLLDNVRDRQTGLSVPPGDAHALARALDEVLDDPVFAARLGRAGNQLVRVEYALGAHLEGLAEIYSRSVLLRDVRP